MGALTRSVAKAAGHTDGTAEWVIVIAVVVIVLIVIWVWARKR